MDQNNQNQPAVGAQPPPQTPTVEYIQKKLNEQLGEAMNQAPAQPAPQTTPEPSPKTDQPVAEVAVPVEPPVVAAAEPAAPVVEPASQRGEPAAPVAPVVPTPTPMPVEPTEASAKAGPSITVYTIENCPFCKAEKEYLAKEGMQFAEKRVDTSEPDLKEMLELSDNFAGVPVTLVKTGDRQRVIKGFTQADFEQELVALGMKQASAAPAPASNEPVAPTQEPAPVAPDLQK